jgi:hypothetical protein
MAAKPSKRSPKVTSSLQSRVVFSLQSPSQNPDIDQRYGPTYPMICFPPFLLQLSDSLLLLLCKTYRVSEGHVLKRIRIFDDAVRERLQEII